MSERGLELAEKHRQERDHGRTVECMRSHRASWYVTQRRCNHSAFNGYHRTRSDYSETKCGECGRRWRTKAAYVDDLP